MNNTLSKVLIFAAGAAVGSAVAWRVLKNYYEKRMDEEAESIIETFTRRAKEKNEKNENTEEDVNETPVETGVQSMRNPEELAGQVSLLGYSDEGVADACAPYMITPDEFGSRAGYDAESLTYYADGVLADLLEDAIEDADDVVGTEFMNHFGKGDDPDFVYVRNEAKQCDYEIERSVVRYADVINPDPHQAED